MNIGDKSVISTKHGSISINREKVQEIIKAEIKITPIYTDVVVAGSGSKGRKYQGQEISGTITINKVDSKFTKIFKEMMKKGYAPNISMQSILTDPSFQGSEVISLTGVTFDELVIFKLEDNANFEQEIGFKAIGMEILEEME